MLRSLVLYTALALGANAAAAADLEALKQGDMRKLVVYEAPLDLPDVPFLDAGGAEQRLSDHKGKVLLVNFWAVWCAPCRAEMPSLDRLQAEMGGEDFEVIAIATGRNPPPKVARFLEEVGVTNLPLYTDAQQKLARTMGIAGLPVSVLIDREGREAARLIGEAAWDAPEAKAVIEALLAE
ncbi:TlpA family protein disulfide reductase [Pseudothioclava arenosa]|uniref:TlpA family protein disulfide reductase n=1 Tax=Pseudothioclava arenosa TaxID=1795308 RepID=UPI001FE25510|nr:TlpA disulfide reductase family protein [Pseudothioclava arenosa]